MRISIIKAVLFDCNETLVDSEYTHYLGWKRALVKFGRDLTLDEFLQLSQNQNSDWPKELSAVH